MTIILPVRTGHPRVFVPPIKQSVICVKDPAESAVILQLLVIFKKRRIKEMYRLHLAQFFSLQGVMIIIKTVDLGLHTENAPKTPHTCDNIVLNLAIFAHRVICFR